MPGLPTLRALLNWVRDVPPARGPWMVDDDRGNPQAYRADAALMLHDDDVAGFVVIVVKKDLDGTRDLIVRSQVKPEDREVIARGIDAARAA